MPISGEYLYSIAAIFSLLAYMLGNILWLRVLLVVAATLYIITGVSLGLTSMAGWNAAYLLINLYHVFILLRDKNIITLPEETRLIYREVFSSLSTREFKKLMSINSFESVVDKQLFKEGSETDKLMIIVEGKADVIKSNKVIASLHSGDLMGEMSFVSGNPASADVVAVGKLRYAFWTHKDIEKLKIKNNDTYNQFIGVIGRDLVKKLAKNN